MRITKGKRIAAGASAAGLLVALTAAITPPAFAADGTIAVTISAFDDAIIAGAPGMTVSHVNGDGVAAQGTWQYPGSGTASARVHGDVLADTEALTRRVTVTGDGIGNAWAAHDVAGEKPYDFWFRYRDYANGIEREFKGGDFRQLDANTLQMTRVSTTTELADGDNLLTRADIQLISNLDWYGDISLKLEFLAAPVNTPDAEVSDDNSRLLGGDSITSRIIPAIEIVNHPEDVTAEPGDDVTFKSSAVSNTIRSNHAPNHIEQDDIDVAWAVSPDGGSTWDGIHNVEDTTLAVSGVTGSQDGFLYIAAFSAGDDNFNVESNPAELTVKAAVEEEPKDEEPAEPSNGKSPSYTG